MDAFKILDRIPEAKRDMAVAMLREAESVDQVLAIAKALDAQVTDAEAECLLHALEPCEIPLDDLDMVAGGCGWESAVPPGACRGC